MGNAARKARKRFLNDVTVSESAKQYIRERQQKPPRVGTPLLERSFFVNLVPAFHGSKARGNMVPRSQKQIAKALKEHGVDPEVQA